MAFLTIRKGFLATVIVCLVLFGTVLFASADFCGTFSGEEYDVPEALDAIQWFPCREGFEADDLWEVQCFHDKETTLAQRFTETAEDTGHSNYLDTVRNADGSLTITRNGADGEDGVYAPYIRTVGIRHVPHLNVTHDTMLHLDFEATAGWSIALTFDEQYTIALNQAVSQACGVTTLTTPDEVGMAGQYTVGLNLTDTLRTIAKQNNAYAEAAASVLAMEQMPIPQVTIQCVGDIGSSLTMYKWLISSPDDKHGENCYFACMGLLTDLYIPSGCLPLSMPTTTAAPTATTVTTAPSITTTAPASPSAGNGIVLLAAAGAVIVLMIVLVCVLRKPKATP